MEEGLAPGRSSRDNMFVKYGSSTPESSQHREPEQRSREKGQILQGIPCAQEWALSH